MTFKLYIHPLCSLSYRIVKRLMIKDLVDKVKIVNIGFNVDDAIANNVWAAPWLIIDNKYVVPSPMSPEEVEKYASAGFTPENKYNVELLLENFKNAVMYSLAASAISYLYKSFAPLLNTMFPKLASRITMLTPELRSRAFSELLGALKKSMSKVYGEIESSIVKYLAINFVRERYWLIGDVKGENISKYIVAHWLLAKATFGRTGLPYPPPTKLLENVNELYYEITENYPKYIRSVTFRLNMINKDSKYLELISKISVEV